MFILYSVSLGYALVCSAHVRTLKMIDTDLLKLSINLEVAIEELCMQTTGGRGWDKTQMGCYIHTRNKACGDNQCLVNVTHTEPAYNSQHSYRRTESPRLQNFS